MDFHKACKYDKDVNYCKLFYEINLLPFKIWICLLYETIYLMLKMSGWIDIEYSVQT